MSFDPATLARISCLQPGLRAALVVRAAFHHQPDRVELEYAGDSLIIDFVDVTSSRLKHDWPVTLNDSKRGPGPLSALIYEARLAAQAFELGYRGCWHGVAGIHAGFPPPDDGTLRLRYQADDPRQLRKLAIDIARHARGLPCPVRLSGARTLFRVDAPRETDQSFALVGLAGTYRSLPSRPSLRIYHQGLKLIDAGLATTSCGLIMYLDHMPQAQGALPWTLPRDVHEELLSMGRSLAAVISEQSSYTTHSAVAGDLADLYFDDNRGASQQFIQQGGKLEVEILERTHTLPLNDLGARIIGCRAVRLHGPLGARVISDTPVWLIAEDDRLEMLLPEDAGLAQCAPPAWLDLPQSERALWFEALGPLRLALRGQPVIALARLVARSIEPITSLVTGNDYLLRIRGREIIITPVIDPASVVDAREETLRRH